MDILDNLDTMLGLDDFDDSAFESSIDTLEDPADQTAVFLEALRSECSSMEEYAQIVTENATSLEVYGLIHDASQVLESTKNIVKLNKGTKLYTQQRRACLLLAKRNNDPLYAKYKKYKNLMREYREKIMQKYEAKGKTEARKIMANSRRKASQIKSKNGSEIVKKMDAAISKAQKKTK